MLSTPLRCLAISPRLVARGVHIERRLAELGYVLPQVAEPKGNYRTAVRTGNYIFTGACMRNSPFTYMSCGLM